MTLSPQEREQVLRMVADRIYQEMQTQAGTIDQLVGIPVPVVARLLSLSPRQVATRLPVVRLSHRTSVVTLHAVQQYLQDRTTTPEVAA